MLAEGKCEGWSVKVEGERERSAFHRREHVLQYSAMCKDRKDNDEQEVGMRYTLAGQEKRERERGKGRRCKRKGSLNDNALGWGTPKVHVLSATTEDLSSRPFAER